MAPGDAGEGGGGAVVDTTNKQPRGGSITADEEEDDFFDVIDPGPSSTARVRSILSSFSKSPAVGGWEDKNDWDDLDLSPTNKGSATFGGMIKPNILQQSSSTGSRATLPSSSSSSATGGRVVDGLNLSSSSSKAGIPGMAPLSSDDLFNMLNDGGGSGTKNPVPTTSSLALSKDTKAKGLSATTPKSRSTTSISPSSSSSMTSKRPTKGRLQAKKMSVAESDWDDF